MGIALEMTKALFDGIGLKYQMIREDAMSIGFSGLKTGWRILVTSVVS